MAAHLDLLRPRAEHPADTPSPKQIAAAMEREHLRCIRQIQLPIENACETTKLESCVEPEYALPYFYLYLAEMPHPGSAREARDNERITDRGVSQLQRPRLSSCSSMRSPRSQAARVLW